MTAAEHAAGGDPRAPLERLLYKYRRLGELRRERARGGPLPARSVFAALAREFPGALNELDTVPLEEIDRRARAIEGALGSGAAEPWMEWLHGYHALMRAALQVKRRLARQREVADERAAHLASDAAEAAGMEIDAAFVRAVARPPRGRITPVVMDRLAAEFGVTAETIADALFPRRRGRR